MSRSGRLRAFWELGKPRLSMVAVAAVVAGAYMGWPARGSHPPLDLLLATTLGTFLAAVVGHLALPQLVLFTILFFWQIPHFLAIAWRYREDYARAGMRMLPVVDPTGHRTAIAMLLYVSGLGIASLVPYVTQMADARYAVSAILLDVLFFVPTAFAALTRRESAMRMTFVTSLVYLPLLLFAMVWWRL
jgi:heme O synthase-like polyprenyltransferase